MRNCTGAVTTRTAAASNCLNPVVTTMTGQRVAAKRALQRPHRPSHACAAPSRPRSRGRRDVPAAVPIARAPFGSRCSSQQADPGTGRSELVKTARAVRAASTRAAGGRGAASGLSSPEQSALPFCTGPSRGCLTVPAAIHHRYILCLNKTGSHSPGPRRCCAPFPLHLLPVLRSSPALGFLAAPAVRSRPPTATPSRVVALGFAWLRPSKRPPTRSTLGPG